MSHYLHGYVISLIFLIVIPGNKMAFLISWNIYCKLTDAKSLILQFTSDKVVCGIFFFTTIPSDNQINKKHQRAYIHVREIFTILKSFTKLFCTQMKAN